MWIITRQYVLSRQISVNEDIELTLLALKSSGDINLRTPHDRPRNNLGSATLEKRLTA